MGIPASAVQTIAEFVKNPQTAEIKVVADLNQPKAGKYQAVNTPILFSKTPVDPHGEAPSHPEAHSVKVLESIGYLQETIDMLLKSPAVHQA